MEDLEIIDIKCCIDWKMFKSEIDLEFGESPEIDTVFNAEIRYNRKMSVPIAIYIFYNQPFFLFEKFEFIKQKGENILSHIQIHKSDQPWSQHELLDFSNSQVLEMVEGHREWKYRQKPVIIRLGNLTYYTDMEYDHDGIFYLTNNACLSIENYSKYDQTDGINISNKPFYNGTHNVFLDWGNMSFGIGFEHIIEDADKHSISIRRIPYLEIVCKEIYTDDNIIEYASTICLMMSLFFSKNIDFYHASIKVNSEIEGLKFKERIEFRLIKDQVDDNEHKSWGDTYENLFIFINNISYNKVITCKKLLFEISNRIIRSQYMDNISEFMLLYNVIEKIRIYYLELGEENGGYSIKEEFDFNIPPKKRDKHIKRILRGITPIVAANDKMSFIILANDKVSFIRKTGLKDQFESLIKHLGLSPEIYKIDFIELIRLRNKLYHGNFANADLSTFIQGMRNIINDLLIKLIAQK